MRWLKALTAGTANANYWHLLAAVLLLAPPAIAKDLSQEFLQAKLGVLATCCGSFLKSA